MAPPRPPQRRGRGLQLARAVGVAVGTAFTAVSALTARRKGAVSFLGRGPSRGPLRRCISGARGLTPTLPQHHDDSPSTSPVAACRRCLAAHGLAAGAAGARLGAGARRAQLAAAVRGFVILGAAALGALALPVLALAADGPLADRGVAGELDRAALAQGMDDVAADRIFLWQPVAALLTVASLGGYVWWKTGRALEAREARLAKWEELRNLETERLAGRPAARLEAVKQEYERLRDLEVAEREIFAFGEATPTTLRTSWEVSLPPDDREVFDAPPLPRQQPGLVQEDGKPYEAPVWQDERAQSAILVFGIPVLSVALIWLSGS